MTIPHSLFKPKKALGTFARARLERERRAQGIEPEAPSSKYTADPAIKAARAQHYADEQKRMQERAEAVRREREAPLFELRDVLVGKSGKQTLARIIEGLRKVRAGKIDLDALIGVLAENTKVTS